MTSYQSFINGIGTLTIEMKINNMHSAHAGLPFQIIVLINEI